MLMTTVITTKSQGKYQTAWISLVSLKRRFAVLFGQSLSVLLLLVTCLGFAFYMNLKCSSNAFTAMPLGKIYARL